MMSYPVRPWNPFDLIERMMAQWDQYFFGSPWPALPSLPQLKVQQDDQEVSIRVEVPGVSPEDLSVTVDGNLLTIRAVHRGQGEDDVATYERAFTLPSSVDPEKVTAHYRHGILEVRLPRAEGRRSRQIPIDLG